MTNSSMFFKHLFVMPMTSPYSVSRIDMPLLANCGYESQLHFPAIRIVVNQNDFLLTGEDLAWLHATFSPEQITVFAQGGHLGNLSNPAVQKTILEALSGLRSSPPKPD